MISDNEGGREKWSSRRTFILAAIGSAVGLGNIWKFPYMTGANGGATFVIIYIICTAVIVVPIMTAEFMLGRLGRGSPVFTMSGLVKRTQSWRAWIGLGWLGIIISFVVLTYFSVIAGWALAYVFFVGGGGMEGISPERSASFFAEFLEDPLQLAFWNALILGVTVLIVSGGIRGGLERAVKWLMPLLFTLLLGLVATGALLGDFLAGWEFMFAFDISEVETKTVLIAMGQAFLSNSVAMGIMMTYGAYTPTSVSLPKAAIIIVSADTSVALLAGLAIFPLVFAYQLTPGEGPGLIFVTLPIAFGDFVGGRVFGTAFFLLLVIAAITSTISLLEPTVSYLEERCSLRRRSIAAVAGLAAFVAGMAPLLSFNKLSGLRPLNWLRGFESATLFDAIDFTTMTILLPLSGFLLTVFAGWRIAEHTSKTELNIRHPSAFKAWRFLLRYVAPLAVLVIMSYNIYGSLSR